MRRILIGGLVVVTSLTACSGGSSATSTSDPTVTFTGVVTGTARLSGEGAGHLCGRQGNAAFLATMRATVSGDDVLVRLQSTRYSEKPSHYRLGDTDASVTLVVQTAANRLTGHSAWVSESGDVTVDQRNGSAGTIDAHLRSFGLNPPSGWVTMKGRWSCDRLAGATPGPKG